MRIAIFYHDYGTETLDCSRPDLGNPGLGGTQYCFLMLAYFYAKKYINDTIDLFRMKRNETGSKLPISENLNIIECDSLSCFCNLCGNYDMALLNFSFAEEALTMIKDKTAKLIIWVHNWIRGSILKQLSDSQIVKKIVFLGQEHYERYLDDKIINKAVVIQNMYRFSGCRRNNKTHNVVFTGGLIPSKGFHYLAKSWKRIVRRVPDAKLFVVGGQRIYGGKVELGRMGLAEKSYEEYFLKFLIDSNKNLLSSVNFLGVLGIEKEEIYKNASVGIINPTGKTEVCPLSAIEMENYFLPIVSKNTNGLPDVIKNKKTGILFKTRRGFEKSVVKLLTKDKLNEKYGLEGNYFGKKQFDPENVILLWNELFNGVYSGKYSPCYHFTGNNGNNFKWLRKISRFIHRCPLFRNAPSLIQIEGYFASRLRKENKK
ncbi:MAG: glycosyltransferase [Bacilli bacterium]|nr:glycosyltransferase [Bacilli bacterium]